MSSDSDNQSIKLDEPEKKKPIAKTPEPTVKKRRRRVRKKTKPSKNIDSDTEKFIKSFKNSNIQTKGRKPIDLTQRKPAQGPYVHKTSNQLEIKENVFLNCPVYVVKNQNEDGSEPAKPKTIPKEKFQKSFKELTLTETCCLCHLGQNEIYGLGELFGPYFIEPNDENDDPKEVFIHGECAIWSKDIYVKDNKVNGLEKACHETKDYTCSCCKKKGASLICKVNTCGRMYHYPCAVKNGVDFYIDSFDVMCKSH